LSSLRRSAALIGQDNTGNGAESAKKSESARHEVKLVGIRSFGIRIECNILGMFNQSTVTALEADDKSTKGNSANQTMDFGTNCFDACHQSSGERPENYSSSWQGRHAMMSDRKARLALSASSRLFVI
jgi:hypothetical protein